MAQSTYVNGYNIGTDVSFSLTDDVGDVFTDAMFGHLTSFSSQAEDNMLKVTPISNGGIPIYQTIWNGTRGSMSFVRCGNLFQRVMSDLQAAYHAGGVISQMTLIAKVRNRDGSTDTYTYAGVQLESPRYGSFSAMREVDMSVGFRASTMTATGQLTALAGLF